jgi:hypothetical protein
MMMAKNREQYSGVYHRLREKAYVQKSVLAALYFCATGQSDESHYFFPSSALSLARRKAHKTL